MDGAGQGSAGVDATLFFTPTFGFTGQAVQSYGAYDEGTWAYFLRPSYDSPTGHAHVRFSYYGERFGDNVNAVGFVRDDNRRELDSALEKTVWFETGFVEQVEYGSNYNVYWGQDGTLRDWSVDQSLELRTPQPVVLRREPQRGVRALREGLPQPRHGNRAGLQHPGVQLGGGGRGIRPQLRCRLPPPHRVGEV